MIQHNIRTLKTQPYSSGSSRKDSNRDCLSSKFLFLWTKYHLSQILVKTKQNLTELNLK